MRLVMFVGAPKACSFVDEGLVKNVFMDAFISVIENNSEQAATIIGNVPSLSSSVPKWRLLTAEGKTHQTGWSQQGWIREIHEEAYVEGHVEMSFLTDNSSGEPPSKELTQYLERSYAMHEDLEPLQTSPACETPLIKTHHRGLAITPYTAQSLHSRTTPSTIAITPTPAIPAVLRGLAMPNLTSLVHIPSSTTLAALEPQTVTVDVVVGIISVAEARCVTIRRTGREAELVEVLVGDETRRGFPVTFWLPERPPPQSKHMARARTTNDLRDVVSGLRRGDVVSMKNLALGRYNGAVHGQSLGRSTSLMTLNGLQRLPPTDGLTGPQAILIDRVRKVSDWTRQFVPGSHMCGGGLKRKFAAVQDAALPRDDTPSRI